MTFALRPAARWVANVKSTPLAVSCRRIPPLAATHASHEAGNLDRYLASDKGPRAVNVPQPHWPFATAPHKFATEVDLPAAWWRLAVAVLLGTILGVGMWSMPVVLPAVQVEFGIARGEASLPYTLTMLGFAFGGVAMGRLSDRFGIVAPLLCGTLSLGRRLCHRRAGAQSHAVCARTRSHRARRLGWFRAADGGHVALVPAPARDRGGDRCKRELPGRHDLAARCAARHRGTRLARDPHRGRRVLRARRATAAAVAAAAGAPRTKSRPRPSSPAANKRSAFRPTR